VVAKSPRRDQGALSRVRALFAACALASLAGCSYYSQKEGEKLAADTYALSTQVQALQKAVTENQKSIDKHNAQLADLVKQVQALNAAAFKNDADFGVQLDQALQEVARLKGLVEGSGERLNAIESQLNKVSDEFSLAEEKRRSSASTEEQKRASAEEALKRERLLSNPKTLIDEVVRLLNDQKAGEARKLLREASQRAESDPRLKKELDVIQFLIAETYFIEGNYQLAATEYNSVRKTYPKSEKVPEALFKMGQCFEKLKLPEDAKLFYKTVVEKHPKSDAARRAKDRLKDLK
jgi:TolA-binding protein